MQYRQLGGSGLRVSELTLGTMTYGGRGDFKKIGDTDVAGARRQIEMAVEVGVNLIDTANMYSDGAAEEIVGEALTPRLREAGMPAAKRRLPLGGGPSGAGRS